MENGQITLFDLFDGTKVFYIPKYQRAYAWGEDQLKAFVEDLENQVTGKAYFYGTILFRQAPKDGAFECIEIVDGQQRITTLVIYLKLIMDRLKETGVDVELQSNTYIRYGGRYKLHLLNEDNVFFENYVMQHNDGINMIRTPSQRRLIKAHTYLEERVSKYPLETLQELIAKVETTIVLTYSVEDNAEATLIFEMTNDRGKRLTNLERSKSFLMHKTYLASADPEHDLERIQQYFIDIYRDFEEIQANGVGEDNILQYHYIAHEKWFANNTVKQYTQYVELVKNKINDMFHKPDLAGMMHYILQYTKELRESYSVIHDLLMNPAVYGLYDLFAMGRTATFYPLLIKTFKMDVTPGKEQFKRVVRLCEIISFRVWGIRRRRSNTGRDWLYAIARDFKGNFSALIKSLSDFIAQYCKDTDFKRYLMSTNLFHEASSSDLRYLYWKYENYLRRVETPKFAEMSYEDLLPEDRRLRYSIEHIAPQNPKEGRVVEDIKILPAMTSKFQRLYLHSLGNLTFDPLSANISKSNNAIEIKDQKYFKKAPLKTQNELAEFLTDGHHWDSHSITLRAEKILKFAQENWNPLKV